MTAKDTKKLKAIARTLSEAKTTGEKISLQAEASAIISREFAPEAKELVTAIEARPETTRNRYGDYLATIGSFKGIYRAAWIKALIDAGGDRQGISDAVEILNS